MQKKCTYLQINLKLFLNSFIIWHRVYWNKSQLFEIFSKEIKLENLFWTRTNGSILLNILYKYFNSRQTKCKDFHRKSLKIFSTEMCI